MGTMITMAMLVMHRTGSIERLEKNGVELERSVKFEHIELFRDLDYDWRMLDRSSQEESAIPGDGGRVGTIRRMRAALGLPI